jgi:hypothetical protein
VPEEKVTLTRLTHLILGISRSSTIYMKALDHEHPHCHDELHPIHPKDFILIGKAASGRSIVAFIYFDSANDPAAALSSCSRPRIPCLAREVSGGRSLIEKNENECSEQPKTTIQNNDHIDQMRTIWSSTPRPTAKNQSAGAGVPMGRRRRAYLAAKRGSSNIQSRWRRSNTRKTTAVTAP